jgi:hypothetical protein
LGDGERRRRRERRETETSAKLVYFSPEFVVFFD